jgi:hypothetical protein
MPNRHFDFEINNLDDVTEHLDALWYEFNQLVEALSARQQCTDPPDTCGGTLPSRRRPGQAGRRKPSSKKAKR